MALTPWWFCPSCGFKNQPHALRRGKANELCEQCGARQDDAAAADYNPAGGAL